jgi:effector-binding domain-containing protein
MRYVTTPELGWIQEATVRLNELAGRSGGPAGPRFVVFHGQVDEDSDGPVEVCVPVRPDAAGRAEPAHREAYIPVVPGHFETPQILSIYDAAFRWVREGGHTVVGPPREVYGYDTDPGDFVCDVAVPFR